MPWRSEAEARWGHTPAGEVALGGPDKVMEYDQATQQAGGFGKLPARVAGTKKAARRFRVRRGQATPKTTAELVLEHQRQGGPKTAQEKRLERKRGINPNTMD